MPFGTLARLAPGGSFTEGEKGEAIFMVDVP
jgi:hypothetical protein